MYKNFNFKGDELITKCTYTTKNRSKFTYGGNNAEDEMCKALV